MGSERMRWNGIWCDGWDQQNGDCEKISYGNADNLDHNNKSNNNMCDKFL